MKNRIVVLAALAIAIFHGNVRAEDLSVFAGAVYNPLAPDYIMGSLVIDRFFGEYDDTHAIILEGRFSYGSLTYKYEALNPFTVQEETTELSAKGGVFDVAANGIYQLAINDIVGLRFGLGFTSLWGGMFSGVKPGLTGDGNPLSMTIGCYGIAGAVIFPKKRIPIVVSISPGVVMDVYGADNLFPFTLPVSIVVGWNGLIDN